MPPLRDKAEALALRVALNLPTRVQRLLWSVMLGDLVSLHLAAHNGVDPGPIAMIDALKGELGRP